MKLQFIKEREKKNWMGWKKRRNERKTKRKEETTTTVGVERKQSSARYTRTQVAATYVLETKDNLLVCVVPIPSEPSDPGLQFHTRNKKLTY